MSKLVGREKEIKLLKRYYQSEKSELVAVYGRRRVGKTYLIRETLGDEIDFEFTGLYREPGHVQRDQFQKELNAYTSCDAGIPSDWFEAFDRLRIYLLSLHKECVTVFLDELPWMDTVNSGFLSAFSRFWNAWGKEKVRLKLFVCGSATTWMLDRLIGDKGGLYGRLSRSIYLAPFTLHEVEVFLNGVKQMNYERHQLLQAYMIFGGIPYYLEMLDPELALSVNVDTLFFAENAPLRTEYDFLFRSLFSDSLNYHKVIEALSVRLKGLTREEISSHTGLSGGPLSKTLENLNKCDFLRVYADPVKKERGKVYQLTDMFTLFHLRFVEHHDGQDPSFWTHLGQSGVINAWQGYAFEQVCLHHIAQMKHALGISGILSNAYAWNCKSHVDRDGVQWKGGQIDLILDRSDQVMNLCEMKYSQSEYIISKALMESIRERTELFRREQKTKKNLRCTFVTLYGIKPGKYSALVDSQITMNDLFHE
ncbi:MAG: ATP-binding protein [Clostridia bacterium]|nr:ATP-binding protein [Clostridia bacterium]